MRLYDANCTVVSIVCKCQVVPSVTASNRMNFVVNITPCPLYIYTLGGISVFGIHLLFK